MPGSSRRSRLSIGTTLMLACALLVLASCGAGSGSSAAGGQSSTLPSPTPTPPSPTSTPAPNLFGFNHGGTATVGNLTVMGMGADCGFSEVLKGDPTQYDAGSIQSIRTDDQANNFSSGVLEKVPGSFTTGTDGQPSECSDNIAITNLSNNTVTLKGVIVTYVVTSQTNSYHYNLFDCTPYEPYCPELGASVPGCVLNFALTSGPAGTALEHDCRADQQQVLPPQQSGLVAFTFMSTPTSQLYEVSISLVLGDGTRIELPQTFNDLLALVSPSQFSCYSQVGDKLEQISLQMQGSECV
jgi:hypothetical protein